MKKIAIFKHNLMRATLTLALIVTCATAWAQNPNLAEYEFTTGQDASKWITLSDNATQIIASEQDDTNSNFTDIGFDFPFGDGTYSRFWTSSNGILSFNSEQAYSYKWQFHSDNNEYQANQPKICGISADLSTGNNGYVKYELTGTAPNRVLVCEFFLYGGGFSTGVPANIKWQVQLHEANAKVVMVYGDALNTSLRSNQIGLSQSESDIWTINPSTHEAIHSTGAVTATYDTWPGANRYYEFNPPAPEDFTDNGDGTYTINTAAGWGMFCDMLDNGESFSGTTVYLGADITITRMANNADPCFRGTFDGQGHTLTLDYGTATNPVDAQFVAPFVMTYWNTSPTFRNLTIDGHIYSTCTANVDGKNTGGLIGHLYGDVTIEHCTSNVEIINSSGGAGDFVGLCEHTVNFNDCMSSNVIHSAGGNNSGFVSWSRASGYEINFTGCVFNGKLLQINGQGNSNGGFIGWTGSNKTVSITNCLYAPAALAEGEAYASYNSATFARGWNATTTATNSYYTTDFNDGTHYTGQGTQAYSITAGDYVTSVANAGTATTYATSGITSYGTGIKYNNVLYAGNGDAVNLTLNHSEAPTGYTFTSYTASAGTLNGTTLTMPNENVIISATMTPNSYTVQFNGNGNTGGSMSDQPFTYDVAQNLTANAFTRTGFAFTEWNTQANGGGTSYTNGQEVINLTDQGTVTLYAQWESIAVSYLDEDGVEQQCINYTLLTGNETYLAAGWYVADGNLTFSNTINVAYGNVHIILKDNAVMNVGTEQSPISEHGIYVYNNKSLNIYAQSTGVDKGRLNVYATKHGIEMNAASLTINGGEVTANGNNKYGIYAYSYSNITINGGQVTATGSSGIYTNVNGSVNINGGQVTATGNDYGISASQQSALTISGGQVTATGAGTNGKGILSDSSTVNISGGQVTANGTSRGISVYNINNGTFTLGWTNPTDYIYANSYYAASTINIAEGKAFIDDDGSIYQSGPLNAYFEAIAGKKLYPYVEGSVHYFDENGQRQLRLSGEYTTLTGNETTLGTAGQETWYVAQPGTLNYTSTIYLAGETHIILCDDAVMNVDVTSTNTSSGIYSASSGYSLSIYGQTNQSGELNVTSTDGNALYVSGDITIAGGKVTASGENGITADGGKMTIKNATVTATGTATTYNRGKGICSYNGGITIDNSNVTATGAGNNGEAIYSENGDIIIRNGGKTTANENNNVAILAAEGDITITGCEVEATGATGIFADNYDNNGDDGNVTIQNAMVTATTTSDGRVGAIRSNHGDITIDNSNVTATGTGNSGGAIFADNGDIIIRNGGKTTANANNVAIYAVVGDITITGCEVEATGGKGIFADNSSNNGGGNVTIQNATVTATTTTTSTGYTGAIHSYNGDITINNSNVTAMGTARYGIYAEYSGNILLNGGKITANGSGFGLNCNAGNVTITGCEVEATGRIGIYANDSDNNGDDGNVTIQNATVTATGSYTAIHSYNGDITIDNSNVEATSTGRYGIYAEISGNILLNGGKITANGSGFGLICDAGNVTIEGGRVEITGGSFGILARNITLGWTNATDYIYVSRYMDNENGPITLTKTFIDEDDNTYSGTIEQVNGAYSINGKTLYPQGVVFKQVAGYGEGSGGWVFIASPVAGSIAPTDVHNLVATPAADFDLYYFDQTREKEWVNYKDNESHTNVDPGFNLVSGKGYLYATKYTKKLAFGGTFITNNEPVAVPLPYETTNPNPNMWGWNLVGNPFTVEATMTDGQGQAKSYYVISGQTVVPYVGTETTIEPFTGVMVKAEGTDESVYFTKVSSNAAPQPNNGSLHIALNQVPEPVEGPTRNQTGVSTSSTTLLDNAIVSFNEGSQLGKFYFGEQNANLYLPQGAEEYAIVSVGNAGEMPVNFKAKENGTYTIAVNPEGVEMIYLHLIDNLTGADVDLLQTPEYTFTAKTTDYASRFKLMFSINQEDGPSTGSGTFAFISNGNLIVNGEGMLQIMDVTGRMIRCTDVARNVSTSGMVPGVYVLRLINGDDVRTQKIVIP